MIAILLKSQHSSGLWKTSDGWTLPFIRTLQHLKQNYVQFIKMPAWTDGVLAPGSGQCACLTLWSTQKKWIILLIRTIWKLYNKSGNFQMFSWRSSRFSGRLPDFFLTIFQIFWKTSRSSGRLPAFSGRLPDFPEDFQIFRKTSRKSGRLPDFPEDFQIFWKSSRKYGGLPDFPEDFQIFWKTSRLGPICMLLYSGSNRRIICFNKLNIKQWSILHFILLFWTINPETWQPMLKTSRLSSIQANIFADFHEKVSALRPHLWIFQTFL